MTVRPTQRTATQLLPCTTHGFPSISTTVKSNPSRSYYNGQGTEDRAQAEVCTSHLLPAVRLSFQTHTRTHTRTSRSRRSNGSRSDGSEGRNDRIVRGKDGWRDDGMDGWMDERTDDLGSRRAVEWQDRPSLRRMHHGRSGGPKNATDCHQDKRLQQEKGRRWSRRSWGHRERTGPGKEWAQEGDETRKDEEAERLMGCSAETTRAKRGMDLGEIGHPHQGHYTPPPRLTPMIAGSQTAADVGDPTTVCRSLSSSVLSFPSLPLLSSKTGSLRASHSGIYHQPAQGEQRSTCPPGGKSDGLGDGAGRGGVNSLTDGRTFSSPDVPLYREREISDGSTYAYSLLLRSSNSLVPFPCQPSG